MSQNANFYYKKNRMKQLRAFQQVVRTGSVTLAAEKLFLSQPSVSLQLQALERELGVMLFERLGSTMKLTPHGEILYQIAQPLVEGIDQLEETFAAAFGRIDSGQVNIGAGESTILYIMPEPVRRFTQGHPNVRLKMQNVTGRDGLRMLRADEIDFAVGSMLEGVDDIIYEPVVTYDPMLITPLNHPLAGKTDVTLADIAPYGLILPPRHLSTWRIVDYAFQQQGLNYTVTLEAGGWEVIKKYVELGLGISIVTDICLTGQEKVVKMPLTKYFPRRSYGIVLRKGRYLSPQAQRFIDIMRAYYAERGGAKQGGVPEEDPLSAVGTAGPEGF
ncbi:MAG TPA: LysR family transcriptional regulator [Novimethylophilus sp.]|jgi:DNA-binding transcriptional LysR family regulator|uniref:LysR family transcriptional regulator n=1 Tax=Novimethylophilus sp. TaxID=2137426 RepID=UPI002F400C87